MPTYKQDRNNSVSHAINSQKTMHFPGSIVGNRYQIIQKLGRQETSKTYLAKDLQAESVLKCAVQQLNYERDRQADWEIVRQYLNNEIAILTRLGDHPQIPQFYAHFVESEQIYLVREYIDGDSLEQEVERKIFNEADTINLIQDVLRILDFVHKTNAIHRDIQPIHIIRRKQDNAFVLIGFGGVRQLESTETDEAGELSFKSQGNWSYVAPEQKAGTVCFGSDLYALAKTAIFALTGKSPQALEQTNLDWSQECQISPVFEAILLKMMSPMVERRYSNASEVLHDLRPLLKIGQTVGGRYSITHYLGCSGSIETYLAENLHRRYQSPCIIKQIELHNANGERARLEQQFTEELSIIERLGYYEQIPQLWDHFTEDERFYLVHEYVPGDSLAREIEGRELSIEETVKILVSALSALQFVHQNRIIHRNIQPANLIIRTEDRQAILTNFGTIDDLIATSERDLDYSQRIEQNYWSPEQIAGRPTVSSDLYALGMTIIEALTGRKPGSFSRDENGKLLWSKNVNLDRRTIEIIDRMVQLNLGQRYQSAEKVLQDLQRTKIGSATHLDTRPQSKFNLPKFGKLPIAISLLGIVCLLGSIEYAFPTIRPLYHRYRGLQLLSEKPQDALNSFTRAIDFKPQSSSAWSGRGEALLLLERYPQALAAYEESSNLDSDNAASWQQQGNLHYRLENYPEAIAMYDRAIALNRRDAPTYHYKGRALYQLQQYETALTMQETALEQDEQNPAYLSGVGQNLFQLGQYDEALGAFNGVRAIAPEQTPLWQDKYLVLEALQRPREAESVRREISNGYVSLIQRQPQAESIWLAQGDFLTSAKMYAKALDSYNKALDLKPNYYEALLGKGKALSQLGRFDPALDTLNIALQLRPSSYLVLQAKGNVYLNLEDPAQASANFERGMEIAPNYGTLWRDRGLALSQQRRYSQAIESLTRASELTPYDAVTWQKLAEVLETTQKIRPAISAIDRALAIEPQNPQLWSQKGLIYSRNAQYNEACETYRQSRGTGLDSALILSLMKTLGCKIN